MMDTKLLIEKAFEAQKFSYAPYSNFNVGAALLCEDGTVYTGCNIENAAYTPTNCGERTAIFKAVSEGRKDFAAIAIVGNKAGVKQGEGEFCAPCAVCRQVMAEFCNLDTFKVIIAKSTEEYLEYTLGELLPLLKEDDLLILTADHGNDPTYTGTDHTREKVPFVAWSPSMEEGGLLPEQDTFAAIGNTIADNFGVEMPQGCIGESILHLL